MPKVTQTEQQESQSRLEDYLEVIYHLMHDKGYANNVDIAERLGVKPPTVSSMLQRLASREYLVYEPYRGIRLTDKGAKIAKSVIRRHSVISELLLMLGVEEEVAYEDTEGIEHHIQPVTIRRIEGLVDFLRKDPKLVRAIRDHIEG
ncbi:MAG TPA: transcriptional regulator MntR [Nitrososphaerales archaeon]|nr:transcriptional regulator MntR [Nitrososphaerales archaeon]